MVSIMGELVLNKIAFSYGARPLLRQCSIKLARSGLTGIIGPNGAGKSTLLKLMAGLLTPQQGTVTLGEASVPNLRPQERARQIAYVPQQTSVPQAMSVWDLVMLGRAPYQKGLGWETSADRRATTEAITQMDCTALITRPVTALSGGEWQRVIIARALAQAPRLLLLDEPIAHLDLTYQVQLMERLRSLHQTRPITTCLAIHDVNLAARYCDRLILMREGEIIAHDTANAVATPEYLANVFAVPITWQPALQVAVDRDEN